MKVRLEENVVRESHGPVGFHQGIDLLGDTNVVELLWDLKDCGFIFEPKYCERTFHYYGEFGNNDEVTLPLTAKVSGIKTLKDLAYHFVNRDFDVRVSDVDRSRSCAPEGVVGGPMEMTQGVHILVESRGRIDEKGLEDAGQLLGIIKDFYNPAIRAS